MISGRRQIATVTVVCLTQLMVAVDITVLHLAVPALTVQLGATSESILWISDVYGFATSGLLIAMGGLGDRIGRRRLLLYGIAGFGVASVLAAYAPTAGLLIAARALMGVAAAALLPSAGSLLRTVFPTQKARSTAIGITAGVSAAGFAVGPIVGGFLLEHFWWGSVFLINVPLTIGLALGARWVPESRTPGRFRVDAPSVCLSFVAMFGLVYALKGAFYAGLFYPDVLAALVVGAATAVMFVRRQLRLREPLIDLSLFANRAFSASVGSNLVAVSTMSAFALVLSQYFQLVRAWSPVQAGLGFVPGALAALSIGMLSGPLVRRIGRARAVALGLGTTALGFVTFGTTEPDSAYPAVLLAQVLFGTGAALTLTVTNDTILGSAPTRRAGAAAAISSTAYELGGAMGIAVIGTVVTAVYRSELAVPPGVPPEVARQIDESFGATAALAAGLPGPVQAAVLDAAAEAFTGGIRSAMLGSAALVAVLALVALVALRGIARTLDRPRDEWSTPTDVTDTADVTDGEHAADRPRHPPEQDPLGARTHPGSPPSRGARP